MTKITVAALQLELGGDTATNIAAVTDLVREAAGKGARVVLPPELFEGPYFCRVEDEGLFATAMPTAQHPSVLAMQKLAAELGIWIPTSFFERDGPHHYNSLAMVNPDGQVAGLYRKSHIPDGPGYEEKFYFRPGNTGFKVWDGPAAEKLGVGICWDQWYPETARAMMLMGAEILFYPTAIGTEPHDPDLDTSRLWRRAMIGHAVSNVVPVVAANRIGTECGPSSARPRPACWWPSSTSPRPAATAPPLASSATDGRSCTGGWCRTFEALTFLNKVTKVTGGGVPAAVV